MGQVQEGQLWKKYNMCTKTKEKRKVEGKNVKDETKKGVKTAKRRIDTLSKKGW